MKLSRLEIFGFKSFAKKLDLKLTGGITAVVGPNGCGKTNVVDSIRWVLGEQRPSQIRLERMEDVLFKGSSTRRQLGMSEVSLTIENVSGILPLDMPEVTVTRRLFRSGESEYLINRKTCRLGDINDLLMDTGMGTDSYSVFELAMINAILSDKTDDRRHIFEEAAGVTKYKARRKSALNKLVGIQEDLDRVGDIIAELQRRVDSLRRQAAKARKYRDMKSELKSRTVTLAAFELKCHDEKASEAVRELESLSTAIESLRVRMSRTTAEIETLSANITNVESELDDTARRFGESMTAIGMREKDLARMDSRLESLDEIVARAREASHRTSQSLDKLAESHGDCAGSLVDITGRLDEVEKSYAEAMEAYRTLRADVESKADRHGKLEQDYRTRERELSAMKSSLAGISARREAGERRMKEIEARTVELDTALSTVKTELDSIGDRRQEKQRDVNSLFKKLAELKDSQDECAEELAVVDGRLRDALERHAGLKAERDFLAEVVRSYEGYSEGVKNAVSSEYLRGKTLGVLADLISTDDRYVPAVEAALREGLQTILVATTDDAVSGVNFLNEGGRGRAAFMPVDIPDAVRSGTKLPMSPGIVAFARDVVRTEERFAGVVGRLFEGVVITDTLASALDLSRAHSGKGLIFVTLAGEMVGPVGDIHGGRVRNAQETAIGRVERLKKLTAALDAVNGEVRALQERRGERSERASVLRGLIAELEKTLDTARREQTELASAEARAIARRDGIMESLANLREEAESIQTSFTGFEAETGAVGGNIVECERRTTELGTELASAAAELNDLRNTLEQRRGAVNALEVERAGLTEKKAALARELEAIAERRESLAQSSGRTLAEINAAEEESLAVGENKKNVMIELESLEKEHERLKAAKEAIEQRHAGLRAGRSEQERFLQSIRRELDDLTRRESSAILRRDETVMVMNNIRQRLADEYYVEPEDIPSAPDDRDFDPSAEKLLLEDLRRRIHGIGDVNLAAEEDYDEEKKRLDFLVHERDDLVEASDTLKETITRINSIARSRFVETFDLIRGNFQTMFHEFFDGGVCDLELEEGVDPLEADIRITARPPGKNVRSINLLSSGERALTAISMLFAIYLVKPSPFCILDEVDAPLDDANIDRYLQVIRRFSERTQFIMVTHNKKTMAAADNLYGITMAEPGLSTLVSVRLSDTGPEEETVEDDSGTTVTV